ncbi:cytochrome c oxidase subunit II [Gloeobacter kilaueensis]|uniref:Cytochrome c oxidase subunit 2 n=1 Tax=Gloeobacter kilaueensis (strain ATCC BAA-2537 / CCAP 1431/1 / ULC 316 / JS1) TaxID=1183438 RepID=U5QIW0_GLOK1|nr:cytochrome c oxidase subunit II [Gloeobacter kilaueensis]AGY58912.1 cytochrome c oxidase subunit II [Gloeobacter kilaueensis JS1]
MNRRNWIPSPTTVWRVLLLVGAVAAVVLISLWFGKNVNILLPGAGTAEARAVDGLFRLMVVIASIITLSILAFLVYAGFAFKRDPNDYSDGPPIDGSLPLEITWTLIPVVLVAFLSIYSFDVYRQLTRSNPQVGGLHLHLFSNPFKGARAQAAQVTDSPKLGPPRPGGPPPLTVNVEAVQWAWIFTYPDSKVTGSELHLPLNRPVILKMTAKDVIHGFWVPEFRLKQDVIPGRTSELRILPTRPGQYVLECTQLCGTYHGVMRATVFVDKPADFDKWLRSQSSTASQPVEKPLSPVASAALVRHLKPLKGSL